MPKIKRRYLPSFKGPIEGYVTNFIRREHWRVASSMEADDLMQEARIIFLRCESRYGTTDTPQHFMSLFKTAWKHHFHDLAMSDSKAREVLSYGYEHAVGEDGENVTVLDMAIGELANSGFLNVLIAEAPRDVATVLSYFLNAPAELLRLAGASWRQAGRKEADGNRMLCKTLGFPEGTDVAGMVAGYLRH